MKPAKKIRRKWHTVGSVTPDLYTFSQVRRLASIGEYVFNRLCKADAFVVKDIRAPGSPKPSWRITRQSYERYLRSVPSIKSSQMKRGYFRGNQFKKP